MKERMSLLRKGKKTMSGSRAKAEMISDISHETEHTLTHSDASLFDAHIAHQRQARQLKREYVCVCTLHIVQHSPYSSSSIFMRLRMFAAYSHHNNCKWFGGDKQRMEKKRISNSCA